MRFVAIIMTILIVLIGAVIIGPSFIDWNKYKPDILTQVKSATGLDVTIDGDVSLTLLPSPTLKIEGVSVAAPRKVKFDTLLTMKSAAVSVELVPLLSKKIAVDHVTLIEPVIQIEMLADGTPSWQTEKLAQAQAAKKAAPEVIEQKMTQSADTALQSISLKALKIEKGALSFIDHKTGASHTLENMTLTLKADSLKGPFEGKGQVTIDKKDIAFDIETGLLPKEGEEMEIGANITLPQADTTVIFNGVTSLSAPIEAQGQLKLDVSSPQKLAGLMGGSSPIADETAIEGLLTYGEDQISLNDFKISLGDFVGNGKLVIGNFKAKNPAVIKASIQSQSHLNLDRLMGAKTASPSADKNQSVNKQNASNATKGLIPSVLTLPMPLSLDVNLNLGGITVQGQSIKGVFADLKKDEKNMTASFKVTSLPGQGQASGTARIAFASETQSPKTGQVTYADPTVTYDASVQTAQLKSFLAAFAPKAETGAVTNLYTAMQADLKGAVSQKAVSLKDSTVTLDGETFGLGGRYEPAQAAGGRAKGEIELTAGRIDLDKIKSSQGNKGAPTSNAPSSTTAAAKPSAKEALKPLQTFSLPLDLGFDISAQTLRMNGTDIQGVRLTGDMTGNKLTLQNASVNNYAGAAMSVKGVVGNLQQLSGLDLSAYVKTQDVKGLVAAFKADTSKLPSILNALEATVKGTGSLESMTFQSNVNAMGGALDAGGVVAGLLETPAFNNLTVRLKHPNLSNAIKAVSPDFKGNAGLAQKVDFYSKVDSNGKTYRLTDMTTTLGSTNFGGNLTIDTGAKPVSVRGDIKAGRIALDQLTGAPAGGSAASGAASGGANKPSSSERWSKAPIDLGWMKTVDVDVTLSADSVTHGKWNFSNPSTALKIGNGQMIVNDMKAGVFGGQANLSTTVKSEPSTIALTTSMTGIDLEKLVGALTSGNKLKSTGTVNFKTDVTLAGNSMHAMINALNGSASLDGTNIALQGFDLAKLARGLAVEEKLATSVTSLIDGATSGGETRFDTVKGIYQITNGVARVTDMVMDGAAATIRTTGDADFPKWFINLDNVITLKDVTDLEPFTVKIKGPLDNPSDTFGKNILEDYLTDKLKRKLAKELPDILGSDVTDKLQKFGILPQQQKQPAPAPAPVPEGAAPADVTPAPAPAPKKIEKPEDALKQILEGQGTPEEAVNDLIKGLF